MSPTPKKAKLENGEVGVNLESVDIKFHHVHLYVDQLQDVEFYKQWESSLSDLANKGSFDPFSGGMRFLQPEALPERVAEGKAQFDSIAKSRSLATLPESDFASNGQDLVQQLIVGLGWRVTAQHVGDTTKSYLVTSMDPQGVKIVVSAPANGAATGTPGYDHFDAKHISNFMANQSGRQGIAVLGFEVAQGTIDRVHANYKKMHPKLNFQDHVHSYTDVRKIETSPGVFEEATLGCIKIFNVYAYYVGDDESSGADCGTVIRFVERSGSFASSPGFGNPQGVLPGLEDVPAVFDGTSIAAYSDHWVSNVTSRVGFLKTLEDTLGFTPKVDFNAGVVAAGEAQIESTVTGNESKDLSTNEDEVLRNQTQVYLPINNALSAVGHVHGFLNEIGQGVQHLASRVSDLVAFIERVNNYRMITGAGFSFLRIPQSYYGRLATKDLVKVGVSDALAKECVDKLVAAKLATPSGIVNLDITADAIAGLNVDAALAEEFKTNLDAITLVVKRARYSNMYSLLRDHLSEDTYLKIVHNKILVDIQGEDILYQIFTCNILQRNAGEESPFLEFIQRVCSECKDPNGVCKPIKPGCGGFGIRNFLTLFLSIEVSKAMDDYDTAKLENDTKRMERADKMITAFTEQLELSNPILTAISDAMTEEANNLELAKNATDQAAKDKYTALANEFCGKKEQGNADLKALSLKYKEIMKAINAAA